MDVEGVWKVEMRGPSGWEPIATAFFDSGNYRAASVDHFTIGTYELDETLLSIRGEATVLGRNEGLLGHGGETFEITIEGTVNGDVIVGRASDAAGKRGVPLRATRLTGLT